MAKGWSRVEAKAQEDAQRREEWAKSNVPQLWLKEGQKEQVRFLEQGPDVNNFFVHEFRTKAGNTMRFTCLNDLEDGTKCPGCDQGLPRKIKVVINLIQRNRPILRKGSDGKAIKVNNEYIVDGHQDEVVVFTGPSTTADMLRQKDAKYHGLMSRDMELSRTGTQFSPYVVEPADVDSGPVPMSEADQALAAKKHNIDEFMKPPTFAEAAQKSAQAANSGGGAPSQTGPQGAAVGEANGFLAGANVPAGADPPNAFGASGAVPAGAGETQQS